MIISTKRGTPAAELDKIIREFEAKGLSVTMIRGTDYNVFGLVGDTTVIDEKQVRANPYVENVQRVSEPYKKANRLFHEADSIIDVGGIKVGGSEKIAVIGAGPAGLSCAYYLAERGYKPTVFEKNERPGGMLVYGIPSYKLEKDVVDAEIEVLRQMGVDIRCGVEGGRDITLDTLRREGYKAFYVAIGCQDGRSAGIPGEDTAGVMTAVDFLHAVAENETYPVEGRAVVIGGGNVAIDVARTSVRCGAAEVSMYCLEPRESMPFRSEERRVGKECRSRWSPYH